MTEEKNKPKEKSEEKVEKKVVKVEKKEKEEKKIEKQKTKSLNKNKYLEAENILKKIAEKTNLSLGELDLYLWYLETGKVLK